MKRLRNKTFFSMLFTAGVLALVVVGGSKPAKGNGVASDFEGIDVTCADGSSFVVSDDNRIAGRSEVELTITDTDLLRVDARYFPDAFPESEWVAPGQTSLKSPAPVQHRGYAIGGQLDGYRIIFTARRIAEPDDSIISECNGGDLLVAVRLIGKIIAPPQNS